ncbi:hypothetical protein QTP88_008763 [Uroleucon formosanum]
MRILLLNLDPYIIFYVVLFCSFKKVSEHKLRLIVKVKLFHKLTLLLQYCIVFSTINTNINLYLPNIFTGIHRQLVLIIVHNSLKTKSKLFPESHDDKTRAKEPDPNWISMNSSVFCFIKGKKLELVAELLRGKYTYLILMHTHRKSRYYIFCLYEIHSLPTINIENIFKS